MKQTLLRPSPTLIFLVLTLVVGAESHLLGQFQTDDDFDRAHQYWEHQKFSAALQAYDHWIDKHPDESSDKLATAAYRSARCAIELHHPDAQQRVQSFLETFPESPLSWEIEWDYGNHLYRTGKWKAAATALDQLNTLKMTPEQKLQWQFKRGHAYFELEEFEKARLDLFAVMESKEKIAEYAEPALYYFSHISYLFGQPQVALEGFESLQDAEELKDIVPIYIAQLLHETSQYERLIEYAPVVLGEEVALNNRQRKGIVRLLGDALYRGQRFEEALPYLKEAYDEADRAERTVDFAYQMGSTYFYQGSYQEALDCFALVTRNQNQWSQIAHYQSASCFLALGEKQKARFAFKNAADLEDDPSIQEDALYNYAKLAYELTFNPFDEAIIAIEKYLETYPNSRKKDEANGFLLEVYMSSKDYDRAMLALERIDAKTPDVKKAYQLVAFNQGVELFRTGKYQEAQSFFQKSRTYPINSILSAESIFWEGEASYLMKDYTAATSLYAQFESAPGSFKSTHYADAMYARGYALFKRSKYIDALSAFRSFLKTTKISEGSKILDTKLRIADCYFANKEFDSAADYYQEIIQAGNQEIDYARYQRSECFLSLNQPQDQLLELASIIEKHPQSTYVPQAKYQAARTHISLVQLDEALIHLESLRNDFPESIMSKLALVDLCLIAMKNDQAEQALQYWEIIRTQYPNDPIASDAYNVVEPLLIDRNLLDDLPSGVGLNKDEIEERLFLASRELALDRNCEKAVLRLSEFTRQYPNSPYWIEAHFFLGSCAYDIDQLDLARQSFETVLAGPTTDFSEQAAIGAATIAWNAKDYPGAKLHYQTLEKLHASKSSKLEAQIGLMRCHYVLEEFDAALSYANEVLAAPETPEDIGQKATFWRGKILFDQREFEQALPDLEQTASMGGQNSAESQFLICQILFQQGDYSSTEQAIFKLINDHGNQQKWQHQGFLLLIDTYISLKDWFQARATAESILEFVQKEEILEQARIKLETINRLEMAELAPINASDSIPNNLDINE
ncbi:MAG: tetratricopeptide repeat protein [Flavobacteriales bacterium]